MQSDHVFKRIAREHGITTKTYHGDNCIFQNIDWIIHCKIKEHVYDFSSVGDQYQNGVAKYTIGTITR